jgi:hypothetical protein
LSDVKEDSDSGEQHHEARAAVGEERERDSGQRGDAHDGRDVDRRLAADQDSEPGCEPFSERILAAQRDVEPGVG